MPRLQIGEVTLAVERGNTARYIGLNRLCALVALMLSLRVERASATAVTITTPTSIPANAIVVHFDGLLDSSFGGPSVTGPYTEARVTLDQPKIFAYPFPPNGSLAASIQGGHLIFPEAISEVGWIDNAYTAQSVTLFADAAGLDSLGTFDITNPSFDFKKLFTPQPQGFLSDTPFRRMDLVPLGVFNTFFVDDLFFVVPEPGAGIHLAAGVAILVYARRRMIKRSMGGSA